jgi:acylphosphatase
MMAKSLFRSFLLLLLFGHFFSALAESATQAVAGTVSGHVHQVGFRAMILKQAIEYNLAGSAKNQPNGTVDFTLQGDGKRITDALAAIGKGTAKSSDVKVATTPATPASSLNTFTVYAWTSTSRHIATPYDLVFTLRADGSKVSGHEAKQAYHQILQTTLAPADLKKLDDTDGD